MNDSEEVQSSEENTSHFKQLFPPPKHRRRLFVVITIVVIVIVVMSSFAVLTLKPTPKVGLISDSQLSALVGMQLVEFPTKVGLGNSSEVVKENSTSFYNVTVPAAIRSFVIASAEYSNTSLALQFVETEYQLMIFGSPEETGNLSDANVTLYNGSYDGFHYTVKIVPRAKSINSTGAVTTIYWLWIIGYSGSYVFYIEDSAYPVSNVKTLVHDQIDAMTS